MIVEEASVLPENNRITKSGLLPAFYFIENLDKSNILVIENIKI